MLKIGLTGGIGSGKTTVTEHFSSLGIPIIDADLIAREITAAGQPALQEISTLFGKQIIDNNGQLKRRELREIIFSNPEKRQQLEAILHPLIRQRMLERSHTVCRKAPYCILSIPLLLESRWKNRLDRILVVDTPEPQQLQRTMQRDHIDEKSAQAIIGSQISRQARLQAADDTIENSDSINDLQDKIEQLHLKYLKLADKHLSEALKC